MSKPYSQACYCKRVFFPIIHYSFFTCAQRLLNAVSMEVRGTVDNARLQRSNRRTINTMLQIPILGGRDECYRMKDVLVAAIDADMGLRIHDGQPRVVVEASPDKKPRLANMAKMLNAFATLGVAKADIKPDWVEPMTIYDIRMPAASKPLCQIARDGVWQTFLSNLESLKPGLTHESLTQRAR